jgi:diguanylate cyclase (GGDEF)-like protein
MISASSAVAAIFSAPIASEVFPSVAPYLILAHIVGAVMTGMLIRREQEQIAETSKLTTEAMTDPLTQLLNRRSVQRIVTELPKPKNPKLGHAMLYMDIDHFKHINDKLGHAAGDEIIQKVRDRVRQCLRPVDIFSRLGGDEFLVVLPAISIEDSTRVAERCRTAVAETPFRIGEESLHVSLSIGAHWAKGIAVFDNHLNHADTALYQAKENGRNAVSFYDVEPSLLIEVA